MLDRRWSQGADHCQGKVGRGLRDFASLLSGCADLEERRPRGLLTGVEQAI